MAEPHSEDSPLLGPNDPSSPARSSPEVRIIEASWASQYEDQSESIPSPGPPENISSRNSSEWLNAPTDERVLSSFVYSQTSMDSGCDCDPTEGDSRSTYRTPRGRPPSSSLISYPHSSRLVSIHQPFSSGVSASAAPLAQKESLDCHCGALDQKCVCDAASTSRPIEDGTPLLHSEFPKVTFRIEGYDEEEQQSQRILNTSSNASENVCPVEINQPDEARSLSKVTHIIFPRIPSYSKSGMLSSSSSTSSMPMCRICHFPQGEVPDALISPCRCSGTMQFIHESCLMKWLDVSKTKKAAACELCNYQYNRHKKFKLRHWELPSCSRIDKLLHCVFLLCLVVMAACATITVYCFKQDRYIKNREDIELTKSEIITLTCGVLFFVAFFTAMYVEVKAKDTLYRLFSRFVRLNQTWHIDDYDKQSDNQNAPV